MQTWEYYGNKDPYWGVLSSPEYRSAQLNEEGRERFFRTGEEQVDQFLALVARHFGEPKFGTALDYGCGVGRLSRALLKRFDRLHAVDISMSMLERTRATLSTAANADAVKYESAANMTDEPADFVLSYIVFQHIRPALGLQVLRKLAKRTSGRGFINIPIKYNGSPIRKTLSAARRALNAVNPFAEPLIPMFVYDLDAFLGVLRSEGLRTAVELEHTPRHEFANVLFAR